MIRGWTHRGGWGLLVLFFALSGGDAALAGEEAGEPYRILVTNDDGIDAPGLEALVKELSGLGEVVVAAPTEDHSNSSQSVTITSGILRTEEAQVNGAALAVAVHGTPADAVSFALLALGQEQPFAVVVAGINRGTSVGRDAHYAGTVGAAMEAASRGVPAIAVAQDRRAADYSVAARFAALLVSRLQEEGVPPGTVLSVNVPAAASADPAKGVTVAPMGDPYFAATGFQKVESAEGPANLWRSQFRRQRQPQAGTDAEAYAKGQITVAPLRFDWTDEDLLQEVAGWGLALE